MSQPTDEYIDVIYTTNNFGQLHAKFPLTHFPQTAWEDKEILIECLENKPIIITGRKSDFYNFIGLVLLPQNDRSESLLTSSLKAK